MIARRELTSQGAKARRFLMDAMLAKTETECFGIEGYGPEKAIYEAIFRSPGIHRKDDNGLWGLHAPTDSKWKSVWRVINSVFDDAITARINLVEAAARLTHHQWLKEGIIPLLMVASLVVHKDEIALYEHGSLVLALDDAVAERLTRNPAHFAVRNTEPKAANAALLSTLWSRGSGYLAVLESTTFLNVATALFRELRVLPPYSQKTKRSLSSEAVAVRDAFHTASEPDVLIFETLPGILGLRAFAATATVRPAAGRAIREPPCRNFRRAPRRYPALLGKSRSGLLKRLRQAARFPSCEIDWQDRQRVSKAECSSRD